ncbi:hypothetical protein [Ruminococcus sp. YE282]|uniref:hypothetical protein n=1 Tax=Ruminococcus sp. YE282 TaxID=3158780 RepID=UPI000880EB8E|nr:hypothetical protein SAMN02910441_00171 [Ruminococcus bromii]
MKFKEFQDRIMAVYAAKFPKSLCTCTLIKGFGKYIIIDCYLGAGDDEFPHRIAENDAIYTKLTIDLPTRNWTEENELPDTMTLEAIRNSIKHKPPQDESYLYCKYTKVSFRKTTGDAEKIIKAFTRFVDRLHNEISEQYANDNLLPDDMELFARKYERC